MSYNAIVKVAHVINLRTECNIQSSARMVDLNVCECLPGVCWVPRHKRAMAQDKFVLGIWGGPGCQILKYNSICKNVQ